MSSEIKVNSLQDKTGTRVLASDSGSAWSWGSGVPSGSIVQVQFHQFGGLGDNESGAMTSLGQNNNYVVQASGNTSGGGQTGVVDVTIPVTITGSKMWIQSQWFGELVQDVVQDSVFFLWRNTTKLASGYTGGSPGNGETGIMAPSRTYHEAHVGSTPEVCFLQYFDTHGISAGTTITYKLGFASNSTSISALYTNRTEGDGNEVGVSSLCVMELAP